MKKLASALLSVCPRWYSRGYFLKGGKGGWLGCAPEKKGKGEGKGGAYSQAICRAIKHLFMWTRNILGAITGVLECIESSTEMAVILAKSGEIRHRRSIVGG